ncbi:MAG: ribose-phosphate diphosphokinase [Candidatus Dormibacteria bacterium]
MGNPYGEIMLLAGSGNHLLGERIASELGVELAPLDISHFADGELNIKITESVRGYDVFLIQPTCFPVNENYMELFLVLDGLRRASASRITTVMPYYGYQRKEKKTQPRDPISAKLVANVIELAGSNRAMLIDVHAEAIQGFFDIPVDHLTAVKILAQHVRDRHAGSPIVVVSPDAGGAQRARTLAKHLEAPIAMIDKRRPRDDVVEVVSVVGDVAGKACVIIDDLISTGSTLMNAARALKEHGAKTVDVVATHGVFSEGALQRLHEAPIDEICITDTVPLRGSTISPDDFPRLRVLSVAPLLAEAIVRVHEGRSVSELVR